MLNSLEPCFMKIYNGESNKSLVRLIEFIITNNINNGSPARCRPHIENLKKITTNCNYYIDEKYTELLGNYMDKPLQDTMKKLEILYKLYDIIVHKLQNKNYIRYDKKGYDPYDEVLVNINLIYNIVSTARDNKIKKDCLIKYTGEIRHIYNLFILSPPEYHNKKLYNTRNNNNIIENKDELKTFVETFTEDELKTFISNYNEETITIEATIEDNQVSSGGKRKSKGNIKKVAKKPVVSQKKQSIYKEILGKQMKIYKMPDSRKEYVKYKGDLHLITDYKDLMKQKANAKTKTKATNVTQQKAIAKTKTKK